MIGKAKANLANLIRLSIVVFLCVMIFLIGLNFITAQKMRYTEGPKRFLFKRKIKMWQERKTLTEEELILDEETAITPGKKMLTSGETN